MKNLMPVLVPALVLTTAVTGAAQGRHGGGGTRRGGGVGVRTGIVAAPRSPVVTVRPLPGSRLVFARPYFAFRPRLAIGSGFYLGYPVAYPYYPDYGAYLPYYYQGYSSSQLVPFDPGYIQIPSSNSSSASGSTSHVSSVPQDVGGVAFQVTPADAAVFVDGVYVGVARDFSETAPPLTLATGHHHFDIKAQGYLTLSFDADVVSNEVLPYSGALQPH